jgi:hypothetical protein
MLASMIITWKLCCCLTDTVSCIQNDKEIIFIVQSTLGFSLEQYISIKERSFAAIFLLLIDVLSSLGHS